MKKVTLLLMAFLIVNASLFAQTEELGYYENLDKALASKENVKHLNLMYQELTVFPIEIFRFPNIEVLDISHNSIVQIPEEIQSLSKLRALYINHNKLISLPNALKEMGSLQILYLQVNPVNDDEDINSKVPTGLKKIEVGNPPKDFVAPSPTMSR